MAKLNKRLIIRIVIISVIIITLVTGLTFTGIFLYQRYTPDVRFAKAEQNWSEAEKKKAYDDIAFEIILGRDDNTLTALFDISGTRTYNKEKTLFEYDIDIMYKELSISVLKLKLNIEIINDIYSIEITKKEGLLDFDTINTEFGENDVDNIAFEMDNVLLYSTQNINISKNGEFSIGGRESVSFLMESVNLIVNNYIDLDIFSAVKDWANLGRVRGNVTYDKAFKFKNIANNHNISLFIPWEDADEIFYNIENVPQNIIDIYEDEEKKVVIEDIPIIGKYTFRFNEILPDGILANIRIVGDTSYEIIN